MSDLIPQQVALSEDEALWLRTVYALRKQHILGAGAVRAMLYWLVIVMVLWFAFGFIYDAFFYNGTPLLTLDYLFGGWLLKGLVILTCTTVNLMLLYYGWALPYRQDADSGVKQLIQLTVTRKEYFPVTGQYFLTFDGSDRRLEVDRYKYESCVEGGPVVMELAIRSGHIFTGNDRVRVEPFVIKVKRHTTS